MLTDWNIVRKKILNQLKAHSNELCFFRSGNKIEICNWEHIQITEVIEGDLSKSFNYVIKGEGNIGFLIEDSGCLTTQRMFQLIVKINGDDVVAIKDNRVDIYDKL